MMFQSGLHAPQIFNLLSRPTRRLQPQIRIAMLEAIATIKPAPD